VTVRYLVNTQFVCTPSKAGNRIQFWCNGQLVIDWKDECQYR